MKKAQTQIATHVSLGIVAASLDESGKFLALDFAGQDGPAPRLRLVVPAASIKMLAEQLCRLVEEMEDPKNSLQMPRSH
jgi:hypothetical protein